MVKEAFATEVTVDSTVAAMEAKFAISTSHDLWWPPASSADANYGLRSCWQAAAERDLIAAA